MSPAEQQVLTLLDQKHGNIDAVAKELCVSHSWVARIKRSLWKPSDPALAPAPTGGQGMLKSDEILDAILPPNLDSVRELRDLTLASLKAMIANEQLSATESVRLLKVLLDYEMRLKEVLTPAVNVFQDNRQQNVQINQLVDKLAGMAPDALRALTGVPQPLTLDLEPRNVNDR